MASTLEVGQKIPCGYCEATGHQPGPLNRVGFVGVPRKCPNCVGGIATVRGAF